MTALARIPKSCVMGTRFSEGASFQDYVDMVFRNLPPEGADYRGLLDTFKQRGMDREALDSELGKRGYIVQRVGHEQRAVKT